MRLAMLATVSFLVFTTVLLLTGCGSDATNNPNPTCGGVPGRTGQTPCSAGGLGTLCSAGQYCDHGTCTPGCTSDDSCSSNEYCLRAVGEAVGACTRCLQVLGSSTDMNTRSSTTTVPGGNACCLNQVSYSCPSNLALAKCAGFDVLGCHAACAISDGPCNLACEQQAAASTHDPSACTRTPSQDKYCSTVVTPPLGGCAGSWNGQLCSFSSQCSSGHCASGKCYADDLGNPCSYDSECSSGNCTSGCCQFATVTAPCTFDSQCLSGNCTNQRCQ